jgi:hypothetical protein
MNYKTSLTLLAIYLILFSTIQALAMLTAGIWPASNIVNFVYDALYWSWISNLDESNLIFRLWVNTGEFWCSRLDSCTIATTDNT